MEPPPAAVPNNPFCVEAHVEVEGDKDGLRYYDAIAPVEVVLHIYVSWREKEKRDHEVEHGTDDRLVHIYGRRVRLYKV